MTDEESVERLSENPPARVLVASDFHIGRGWDPVTKTCVATENFFADETFAAWIDHYAERAAETLLILNGDIFDVLRIVDVPRDEADAERWSRRLAQLRVERDPDTRAAAVTKWERKYGLQTDDYKTVWKLMVAAEGHPTFLDALARWVGSEGRLLFITGNHDVEMHWPLVRAAIRFELAARGVPADQVADRVTFEDSHIVLDNLYVEHGHQYEEMTRVDGPPTLPPDNTRMNLPLGSLVNRYFINTVEALDPFIDNVKPVEQALLRLARQRPLKILTTYRAAWKFLYRAIRNRRFNRAVFTIGLALAAPLLAPALLLLIPGARNAVLGWLPFGDVVSTIVASVSGIAVSGVLPYLLGAIGELRRRRPPTDHHLKAAAELVRAHFVQRNPTRSYVCMGHTHVTAMKRIAETNHLYVNTGTWIALWPRDRPDLIGRTLYTYAVFDATPGDGYQAELLEWDPHADRPRPATILVPAMAHGGGSGKASA
jgi:UDP-2,3-diacylglucosamine pyrophosphatase LpxH